MTLFYDCFLHEKKTVNFCVDDRNDNNISYWSRDFINKAGVFQERLSVSLRGHTHEIPPLEHEQISIPNAPRPKIEPQGAPPQQFINFPTRPPLMMVSNTLYRGELITTLSRNLWEFMLVWIICGQQEDRIISVFSL